MKEIEKLIEIVKEGDNIQMNDKAFVKELKSWIRFSDKEALKTRDGLSSRAGGNPVVPQWLGNILMDFFAGGKEPGGQGPEDGPELLGDDPVRVGEK